MSEQLAVPGVVAQPLSELRRTSQAHFEQLTDVLGEVHGGLGAIATDVARLNGLLAEVGQARQDVGQVRLACITLADHLVRSHAAITASTLPPALADGTDAAETLRLECRQLRAIASMTRVAGRAANVEGIEAYIVSLRTMIQRLEDTSQVMREGLRSVATAVTGAATYLADASLCARRALEPRHAVRASVDLQELSSVTGMLMTRLGTSTQDNTGVLMNGIQFSDAFAQRLQHVEIILDAAQGRAGPQRLASAQLAALCLDAEMLLKSTQAALQNLGTDGQSAARALAGDIGGQAAGVLADWQSELDDGQTLDGLVTPALRGAMATVEAIDAAMEASARHLETLSATAQEVRLAAVNSGLLARRSGSGSGKTAMAVLSTTVQERAQVCSGLNLRCRSSFRTITELTGQAGFALLAREAEGLTLHIARARDDLARVSDLFSELDRLKQAAEDSALRLQHAVDRGLGVLSGLPALVARIGHLAIPPAGEVSGMPDPAELEVFRNLYTMDREREVHAQLIGAEPEITVAPEQSMEDIFF
ncbi:hypothetical protein [Paracoccus sp. (in: a-proteobacteria)]|uniref:hypothetical protein n=1 Tax=Paracoccus sp. TaxID=267 RepID=UPI00396CB707